MDTEFQNRVVVITGAGAGFGADMARAFAKQGAHVAVLDIDVAAAAHVAEEIKANGGSVASITCDVADKAQVEAAIGETVKTFGGVDILINNAGLHSAEFNTGFTALGDQKVQRLFDVNVMGVINCSVACRVPMAARQGGVILNISSIAAYMCTSAYGVSKLAVRGLTMSFAHEFAGDRIRVNAIAPGLIATDKIRSDFPESFFEQFSKNLQLIHRTGEASDIVGTALFLCSDRSNFMTGETLKISGGYPLNI